jgi:hypothetical protein
MKIIRICASEDGGSRLQEVEVPIDQSRPDQGGRPSFMSKAYSSPDVSFIDLPEGIDSSWHHAPARQIVMVLQGVLEVCTSDNQKRQWSAGELLFADDLTGKGHMTRTVGGAARLLIVQLPQGLDFK